MNEQEFVAQQFQKAFSRWRGDPFVLYGLGKNTEAVLTRTEGFRFEGLMDARNTGKCFWGLPVLSEEEAAALHPRIVIIARESVVPVIYARIAKLEKDHGLEIYNFKGERLGQRGQDYGGEDLPYWRVTEEELRGAIDACDCVSFDIFDTLLMRRVLVPEDVFEIEERLLEKQGYVNCHFRELRVRAERALEGYPALDRIYEELGRQGHISGGTLEAWKRLELTIEERVLVPRRKMVEMFRYALAQGKRVFLISDMYIPGGLMRSILKKRGIYGYEGLLISCDHRKGKEDGSLYEVCRRLTGECRCLHIGDNRRSDGERARENGLDTFQIYSAYEMWMASSMHTTLAHVETLERRCILGNLVWRCCEDPFAVGSGRGRLLVDTPRELGYVFLGALYTEFVLWLKKMAEAKGIEQLLLPARDGYLIARMLAQEENLPFVPVYFKASRRAVSVAAIESEDDIRLLAQRGFQGTLGDLLQNRFGIVPREDDIQKDREVKCADSCESVDYALSYKREIFQRARQERDAYLAYLENVLTLGKQRKRAVFDFVASGTVQYFLKKLLGTELYGLYFATMNHPDAHYHLERDIASAYGNICSYHSKNQVAKHYLFLESIMVDGFPTLRCMENGEFVYEAGEDGYFSVVQEVQEGILRFQRDMREMWELVPDQGDERTFADELFGTLFDGSCQISQALKECFSNDDSFNGVEPYRVWGKS